MIWSYSSHLHRKATPVHSSPDCLTFWSYFPMACWLVIGSCLHIHICTLSLSNQRASGNIVEILIKILPKTTMNSLKEMMFAGWSYVLLNVNLFGVHVTICHYYIPLYSIIKHSHSLGINVTGRYSADLFWSWSLCLRSWAAFETQSRGWDLLCLSWKRTSNGCGCCEIETTIRFV
jgi:hypothetical protein